MRFDTALVAAASIASTSAFLVTPEIANAISEAKSSLAELLLEAPHTLNVKCHECPAIIETSHGEENQADRYRVSVEKMPTTIHLDFSTTSGYLQVNNETVFPLEAVNNKFPRLSAHQTRLDTGEDLASVPIDFVLSSQVREKPRHHPNRFGHVGQDDYDLITIDFTVIGLAGQPIKSQTAHADLILHHGTYSLVRLEAAPFNPTAPGEDDLQVCKSARNVQLCRIRLIANRKLREMMMQAMQHAKGLKEWMKTHGPGNKPRPCHGFRPGRIGTTMKGGHRFEHGQHGPHGHRHGRHGLLRGALFLIKALVIPALLGFLVGFTVSAVGMLVGQFIVFVWSRFYRGHRGAVRDRSEVAIEEGEKEGLMAEGEAPPAYEYRDEVPEYADAEVKA